MLLKRDSKDEIHQNLAALIYANKHLGIDFWLEYLPAENFFGYAKNVQQRAIEALESDGSSDEIVTQAAIFLAELHKGIGPVQVALSSDDKVRVAGRIASLLDRLAEQPAEIEKLLALNNQFANLALTRYYSPPYSSANIVSAPQSPSRKHGSLALELLDLAEITAQYSITDASVNRVIDGTLEPFLSKALRLSSTKTPCLCASVRTSPSPIPTLSSRSALHASNHRRHTVPNRFDLLARFILKRQMNRFTRSA